MSTTVLSPDSLPEIPLTPEERQREVAVILATGLMRLRTRPELAPGTAVPGQHAAPEKTEESGGKPLASPRT